MSDLPNTLLSSSINVRGYQSPKQPPSSTLNTVEDDSSSTVSHSSAVEVPVMNLEEPDQLAKLRGHPCAAGCGHFCWAASGDFVDL